MKPKEEKNNLHYTEPKSGISEVGLRISQRGKWNMEAWSKKPENIHRPLGSQRP